MIQVSVPLPGTSCLKRNQGIGDKRGSASVFEATFEPLAECSMGEEDSLLLQAATTASAKVSGFLVTETLCSKQRASPRSLCETVRDLLTFDSDHSRARPFLDKVGSILRLGIRSAPQSAKRLGGRTTTPLPNGFSLRRL